MQIPDIFHVVRKLLVEIVAYFIIQGLLLVALTVLIIVYPYALALLFALVFFIMAIVSLYAAIRISALFHKVKVIKNKIVGE